MTTIYFVRHAESNHKVGDNATRPLTEKGMRDRAIASEYLKDKKINRVLSSPFKRAIDTVADFSEKNDLEIELIDDFRERKSDTDWMRDTDFWPFIERQWNDFNYKLSDGECLHEVQDRNIRALNDVLIRYSGENVIIGTHGTALSTIINYYDNTYGYADFMNMVNIMPWIVKIVFNGIDCVSIEKINVMADLGKV